MSFRVDTDALREFAVFLGDYSDDVERLSDFYTKKTDMGAREEGFFNIVSGIHMTALSGMKDRSSVMRETASHSALSIDSVAFFYDDRDEAVAAELDATYPGADTSGLTTPEGEKGSFAYESVDGELEVTKKPGDLEPKANAVEEWCRKYLDQFSVAAAVRTLLNELCGFDPLDWVRSWFSGDWEAWAKCALVWSACGDAATAMAENVDPALVKLPQVWEGNAADGAIDYFGRFREATMLESRAFMSLEELYKVLMEMIYEVHLICNDVLNTIIDIATDAVLLAPSVAWDATATLLGQEHLAGQSLARIWDLVGQLGIVITGAIDAIRVIETFVAAWNVPGMPECEFPNLNDRQGSAPGDHAYEHPDSDVYY